MPKFECPHCTQRIDAPEELAGTDANCPNCGGDITVPVIVTNELGSKSGRGKWALKIISGMVILFLIMFAVSSLNLPYFKQKKVDASSDEAMKESIQQIEKGLSPEEKEDFRRAVMLLSLRGANLFDTEGVEQRMKSQLDGKTAAEIIAQADQIRSEQTIAEQKQIVGEITELEKSKREAEIAKEQLKAFEVLRSRFYYGKDGYIVKPTIELTVRNGLREAVSRAYFHGVLITPGRSVPWIADDFNYSIRGGLESGEQVTWKLSPNMFSDWGKVPKDRKDMVFTVTVTRLDGADGEPIFDGEFSEYDQDRLEGLKNKLK